MNSRGRYHSISRGLNNYFPPNYTRFSQDFEDKYVDVLDPNKLLQCPYDKSHQIRACRFPYHLVKCRKSHPEIAERLVTCPFNARHRLSSAQLDQHISTCDDKMCLEMDVAGQSGAYQRDSSIWRPPPCSEDWEEEELEEPDADFVLGASKSDTDGAGTSTASLGSADSDSSEVRSPRKLPWKTNDGN